jgi:hypothetical protein
MRRIQHSLNRKDWRSGSVPGTYLGVVRFESRLEHFYPEWLFPDPPKNLPQLGYDQTLPNPFQFIVRQSSTNYVDATGLQSFNIITIYGRDYRRGVDW